MQQFEPEVIRYFIVGSHYRSPLNFSDSALKDAKQALSRFYQTLKAVGELHETKIALNEQNKTIVENIETRFNAVMNDDFNTPEAIATLFELTREINRVLRLESVAERAQAFGLAVILQKLGAILGLLQSNPVDFLQGEADAGQGLTAEQIEQYIEARQNAKVARDFALADQIRKDLLEAGVVLEDGKNGTTWRRSE
jgi:cysteinyl-tRNA synthetase